MDINVFNNISKEYCITILPHNNIDVDAIISEILFSEIFDCCNVQNEVSIFDENVDKWTDYFLKKLGYDLFKFFVKSENHDKKLFLVEQNNSSIFCYWLY